MIYQRLHAQAENTSSWTGKQALYLFHHRSAHTLSMACCLQTEDGPGRSHTDRWLTSAGGGGGSEGRETQKHREREWWQSDVETTQNRKWWGQVFSKHDGKLTNTRSNIRLFFFFLSLVCCLQNAQQSCMWNSYNQQVEVNLCFILLTKKVVILNIIRYLVKKKRNVCY